MGLQVGLARFQLWQHLWHLWIEVEAGSQVTKATFAPIQSLCMATKEVTDGRVVRAGVSVKEKCIVMICRS